MILGASLNCLTIGNVQEKTVIVFRASLHCRVEMCFSHMLKILYAHFSQSAASKSECQRKMSFMHTMVKEGSAVCAEKICWATSCYLDVWFIFWCFPVSPDLPSLLFALAERFLISWISFITGSKVNNLTLVKSIGVFLLVSYIWCSVWKFQEDCWVKFLVGLKAKHHLSLLTQTNLYGMS